MSLGRDWISVRGLESPTAPAESAGLMVSRGKGLDLSPDNSVQIWIISGTCGAESVSALTSATDVPSSLDQENMLNHER